MDAAFVYSDKYFAYDYGNQHPLRIERLRYTYELCREFGLLDDGQLVEAAPATEAEVLQFHSAVYINTLKRVNSGEVNAASSHGLGVADNPIFPGVWNWSLLHAGGSIIDARLVAEGKARVAFHIAGGLHHAMSERASGFCYVNDPVLAIMELLKTFDRVMYVDVDVHHGDGVQFAFYDDPRVLTISLHQDGRTLFPGSGRIVETGGDAAKGYSLNMPLMPGTDDEVYLEAFMGLVPPAMERFKPDAVVVQLGVDTFLDDPLGHLELTTNGFCEVVRYFNKEVPRLVALGGGGYDIGNVARAWTLAWGIFSGRDVPDEIPLHMINPPGLPGGLGKRLRDEPHRSSAREACVTAMRENLKYLEDEVLPLIRPTAGRPR